MSTPTRKNVTGFTDRGFGQYGEGKCSYNIKWRVQESSTAGDPRVWLFVDGVLSGGGSEQERTQKGCLHMSIDQAKELRDALQRFLDDSVDPAHWKNTLDYNEAWRAPEEEDA
jgi:hypothetical protein